MGGICMALYGFIAVSGLKMVQKVNLEDNRNLFVVSVILIAGIGGLALNFGKIQITSIATALILGILVNIILSKKKK
jgi:uracil permease